MTTPNTTQSDLPPTLRNVAPQQIIRDPDGSPVGVRFNVRREQRDAAGRILHPQTDPQKLGWSICCTLRDRLYAECVAVGQIAGDAAMQGVERARELCAEVGMGLEFERTVAEEMRADAKAGWSGSRPVVRIRVRRTAEEAEADARPV